MAIEKNILTTKDLGYGNLVTLDDDTKLLARVPYELISDEEVTMPFGGHLHFNAGEKIKVTGLLAEKILLYAKRKGLPIRLYNDALQKQRSVTDTVIETQSKVAELEATIASMKEKPVVAKETVKKKTTSKKKK